MTDLLTNVLIGIFSTTLQLSPLYIFAGMGEIVAEKSGVANMGIEGIMLMAAFTTLAVDFTTGNPWLGILAALAVAGLIGAIFAYLTVRLRLDQIVLGLAVYLFGLGLSFVLYSSFAGGGASLTHNIPNIYIPFLSDIPIVGRVLFQQNPLVYFALALVIVISFFLGRTSLGLRVRAVGENPKAADNMGVNVLKVRFLAVLLGAMLAGLAGAYFEIGFLQSFQFDIIAGRGFIALAMIYLANWGPFKTLFAAISFNIVYAAQSEFVSISGIATAGSSQLFNMLPYVFLLALIPILGRKARFPKYLLKPYRKG
ncbi:MAG: ABC transporter permease [Nitrososphaerales archaeon]|nr:ABC transporter permease [Nitrososphaerales archaeon]